MKNLCCNSVQESDDEEVGDEDDEEPPDPESEDSKDRLQLDPALTHMPGHLDSAALLHNAAAHAAAAGLSDPLKSYLSAAYNYSSVSPGSSSDVLTASSPLIAGLAIPGQGVAAEARNVIKVKVRVETKNLRRFRGRAA